MPTCHVFRTQDGFQGSKSANSLSYTTFTALQSMRSPLFPAPASHGNRLSRSHRPTPPTLSFTPAPAGPPKAKTQACSKHPRRRVVRADFLGLGLGLGLRLGLRLRLGQGDRKRKGLGFALCTTFPRMLRDGFRFLCSFGEVSKLWLLGLVSHIHYPEHQM